MTVGGWQFAVGSKAFAAFCLLPFYFCLAGCRIPNLEPQSCIDSRTAVREFYSVHFGNEMHISPDRLKMRERFLTTEFATRLASEKEGVDPFTTGTTELPKAFRVGACTELAPDRTLFQVLLFWKDDVRSEQREIKATVAKQGDKWLIDDVSR